MSRGPEYLIPDSRPERPAGRESLESKAGSVNLDEMQHRRRMIMRELAPLQALHGRHGVWDAHRRQLRGAIAAELRASWNKEQWGSPTKDAVEDRACADPRYLKVIEDGQKAVVRMIQLETQALEIQEIIKDRESTIWAWGAEARLK